MKTYIHLQKAQAVLSQTRIFEGEGGRGDTKILVSDFTANGVNYWHLRHRLDQGRDGRVHRQQQAVAQENS